MIFKFFLDSSTSEKHVAEKEDFKKSLIILAGIFISSLIALSYVYMMFPELEE